MSQVWATAIENLSKRQTPTLIDFIESIQIEDKDIGGLAKFVLWDCQKEVAEKMMANDRVIVLKARQLGLTWLTLAVCLYEATFWGNRLFLLASKREDEGKEMLRRVRLMHDTLPPEWRAERRVGDDSKLSMSFANGCKFQVLPATQTLARSYAAYAAVIDEMAFMPYQSEMWAAVEPAARIIRCISTGYRKADLYFDLWKMAEAGKSEFVSIFLPWTSSPRRDAAWYEVHVTNAPRIRLAMREFPECVVPGTRVGTSSGIIRIEDAVAGMSATFGNVVNTMVQPESPLCRVTTKLGYEISGTYDHPLFTSSGDLVEMKDSVGEMVVLHPPMMSDSMYAVRWVDGDVDCSVEIDEDMARLAGYFLGDGSFSCNTLSFGCDKRDTETIDDISDLCFRKLGLTMVPRTVGKNGGCIELRVCSKRTALVFEKLGLIRRRPDYSWSRVLRVPDFIFRSPRDVAAGFLSGLFESDGFNAYNTSRISFFSKDMDFLKDIQLLLLCFGITCRRGERFVTRYKSKWHNYTAREINLRGEEARVFNREIGFVSSRKTHLITPGKMAHSMMPLVMEDVVESCEDAGFGPTYNLTISGGAAFDANGIKTHNSSEQAFSSAEGLFFDRFDQKTHVKDFDVHRDWNTYRCVDFGYRHAACVYIQTSRDGQIHALAEFVPKSFTTGEFGGAILAMDQQLNQMYGMPTPILTFCDPAGYSKNTQTAMSDIEIFREVGLFPMAKTSSVRDGCVLIQHHLVGRKSLIIHPGCRELITSFETLEPDSNSPDVYAKDNEFDHVMDALRYGMVNVAMGTAGHFDGAYDTSKNYAQPITAGLYTKLW